MQPLYNFLKMCNLCIAITINLFLPMSRWCLKVIGISKHLVWCHMFGKCQNLGESNEMYHAEGCTIQFSKNVKICIQWKAQLSNFLKMCNLCIAITINLFLPMSRWCLKVIGISKHLVWCRIFGKCQNLGESDEMYQWKAQLNCYTIF